MTSDRKPTGLDANAARRRLLAMCSVMAPIGLSLAGPAAAQLFPQGASITMTAPTPVVPPPAAQAAPPVAKQKPKPKPKAAVATTGSVGSDAKPAQAIALLVNDEPITAYEIEQRAKFLVMSSNIGAQAQENFKRIATAEATTAKLKAIFEQTAKEAQAQGKTREQFAAMFEARKKEFAMGMQKQALDGARAGALPKLKKDAQEELIEEKLKLQEAKKVGIEVSDEETSRIIKGIAERNKVTEAQFAQNLRNMGTDVEVMKARFKASFAWREVVRRKFAGQIAVNQRDVDKLMEQSKGQGVADSVELQIQKITLPLPAKLDQAGIAQRLADADGVRRKFGGCKTTAALAQSLPGAKFEDTKTVKPSSITEPTRSFLLNAKEGEMLPPQTASAGIEVYALCGRKDLKPDDKKREEAQAELQSREFEQLAKRYLRDLRQDATIEIR